MYCHICGKEISSDEKYCCYCSAKVPEQRENRYAKLKAEEAETSLQKTSVPVSTNETAKNKTNHQTGFICPTCGNRDLQISNEVHVDTTTTGGGYSASKGCCGYLMLGPIGLLCGACGSSPKTSTTTTNTMCFYCNKCGKRFRKPSDLREEADSVRSNATASMVVFFVIAVVQFIILAAMGEAEGPYILVGLVIAAIFVILAFVLRAKSLDQAELLDQEAKQIEEGMKKHR